MKIGFCGTMSVGKTTLTKELVKLPQFKNYHYATERSKYLNSLGIPLNHQTTIEGQTIFLAERVTELMQPNIITDRTIIDVMAFTKCSKHVSYIDADEFENYAKRFLRSYNHIFYIPPTDIPMEDNGIRETDLEYRKEIDETIYKLLLKYRPAFHVISGTTEERIEKILKVVNI